MLQRLTIPHSKALIINILFLEGEICNIIMDRTGSIFVKSILFGKKGVHSVSTITLQNDMEILALPGITSILP